MEVLSKDCSGGYMDEPVYDEGSSKVRCKFSKWGTTSGMIYPTSDTFDQLERGYYSLGAAQNIGVYLKKMEINTNALYRLPNEVTDMILEDISKFWTLEGKYKQYGRVFKRNYLLYSAPGTGKTSLITLMCRELIEKYNGIVINITNSTDVYNYIEIINDIKAIEPERRIIVVMEDIDSIMDCGGVGLESSLLNILDGNFRAGNVVIIATTNHIERLEGRFTNRPSRFDRVVEFPLPNNESRKMFIEKSVLPEDLEKIDVDEWVEKTEGYTIDHINEVIVMHLVHGYSKKEAFDTVDKMVEKNNRLKNEKSVRQGDFGFGVL